MRNEATAKSEISSPTRPSADERRESSLLSSGPLRGAAAGALATIPMTAVIYALDRLVPHDERGELPPRQITEELAERARTQRYAGDTTLDLATEAAHFGFGASTGAIYGAVAERLPLPPLASGVGFGLAVWTASYAGLLPKLGLQPSPDHRPAWRNATMIAGHVIWGAALGWSEQRLRSQPGDSTSTRSGRADHRPGPAEVHW